MISQLVCVNLHSNLQQCRDTYSRRRISIKKKIHKNSLAISTSAFDTNSVLASERKTSVHRKHDERAKHIPQIAYRASEVHCIDCGRCVLRDEFLLAFRQLHVDAVCLSIFPRVSQQRTKHVRTLTRAIKPARLARSSPATTALVAPFDDKFLTNSHFSYRQHVRDRWQMSAEQLRARRRMTTKTTSMPRPPTARLSFFSCETISQQ
jgi:ferredoxin